jgi:hypothetical protein
VQPAEADVPLRLRRRSIADGAGVSTSGSAGAGNRGGVSGARIDMQRTATFVRGMLVLERAAAAADTLRVCRAFYSWRECARLRTTLNEALSLLQQAKSKVDEAKGTARSPADASASSARSGGKTVASGLSTGPSRVAARASSTAAAAASRSRRRSASQSEKETAKETDAAALAALQAMTASASKPRRVSVTLSAETLSSDTVPLPYPTAHHTSHVVAAAPARGGLAKRRSSVSSTSSRRSSTVESLNLSLTDNAGEKRTRACTLINLVCTHFARRFD